MRTVIFLLLHFEFILTCFLACVFVQEVKSVQTRHLGVFAFPTPIPVLLAADAIYGTSFLFTGASYVRLRTQHQASKLAL